MSDSRAESWCAEQLADPEFRAEYLREVTRMHREAIATGDPLLARWCMRQRAELDSSGSTR
jgi:hypothetical protein